MLLFQEAEYSYQGLRKGHLKEKLFLNTFPKVCAQKAV